MLIQLIGPVLRSRKRLLFAVLPLSVGSLVCTALEPLVLALAVEAALGARTETISRGPISLNNMGVTLAARLSLDTAGDRLWIVAYGVGLYLAIVLLNSVMGFCTARLVRRFSVAVASELRQRAYSHILDLPMPLASRSRAGDLASSITTDVHLASQSLDLVLRGFWESGLLIVVYGLLLFRTEPLLATAAGLVTALGIGLNRLFERDVRSATTRAAASQGLVAAHLAETLHGLRVIKSLSAELFAAGQFRQLLERSGGATLRQTLATDLEVPARELLNASSIGLSIVLAFASMTAGRLTLPGFVLFVFVARRAIVPLSHFSRCAVQLGVVRGGLQRIGEILALPREVAGSGSEVSPLRTAIAFRGLTFGYEGGPSVLQQIDLDLPKGQVVALVGRSGSGKSTLADLLLRFSEPGGGAILWDGHDVRTFRLDSYRKRFGVVPQEALLFNTSIEENIAWGRPLVVEEVQRAACLANAHEFVERLPERYRTPVGERGTRLSGGERQRIAIARALYGQPDVLILDEATSSLDSESERQVQAGIECALAGTTALVIAHRLSTVRRADKIAVLEGGTIVATGRHEELLRDSISYRNIWESQFS